MMLEDAFYLDTRPNMGGLFAAPVSTEDYGQWLRDRCAQSHIQDGGERVPFGVAQKLNQINNRLIKQRLANSSKPAMPDQFAVHCIGPHAAAAAAVLREIAGSDLQITILG